MFEYLKNINEKLYIRGKTVEKNIKAASNSFYDSYLDLLEEFLKEIVSESQAEIKARNTCGELLRNAEIKKFLFENVKLSESVYGKLCDYTLKSNAHKHKNEKNIQAETVVNYLRVFTDFANAYLAYKHFPTAVFNFDELVNSFGITEKENENLKEEVVKLKTDNKTIADISDQLNRQADQLDKQGKLLEKLGAKINETGQQNYKKINNSTVYKEYAAAAFKDFIGKSDKRYRWTGTEADFKREKYVTLIVILSAILLGIISTIITTRNLRLYSPFSLFENIMIFPMVWQAVYILHTRVFYSDVELSYNACTLFAQDNYGVWRDTMIEKKPYKIIRILTFIAVGCNFIMIIAKHNPYFVVAIIFELLFVACIVASKILQEDFYCGYVVVYFCGVDFRGKPLTLVYNNLNAEWLIKEEYEKKYPF